MTLSISLVSLWGTNKYLKEYLAAVREEKHNQTKQELLNVLERHIVNNKEINGKKIENLISAVNRKYSTPLPESASTVSILQDLELRIEESRHLDVDQKEQYTQQIEGTIQDIRESREEKKRQKRISKENSDIIKDLEENVEEENLEEASDNLRKLKNNLANGSNSDKQNQQARITTGATNSAIMALVSLGAFAYIVFNFISSLNLPSSIFSTNIFYLIIMSISILFFLDSMAKSEI